LFAFFLSFSRSNSNSSKLPIIQDALWRLVDPFEFSSLDKSSSVVDIAVGNKLVWCVDQSGYLYLRSGCQFFRRVTEEHTAVQFMGTVQRQIEQQSFTARNNRIRWPFVVRRNPANAVSSH
jgi:hypothetical protein